MVRRSMSFKNLGSRIGHGKPREGHVEPADLDEDVGALSDFRHAGAPFGKGLGAAVGIAPDAERRAGVVEHDGGVGCRA